MFYRYVQGSKLKLSVLLKNSFCFLTQVTFSITHKLFIVKRWELLWRSFRPPCLISYGQKYRRWLQITLHLEQIALNLTSLGRGLIRTGTIQNVFIHSLVFSCHSEDSYNLFRFPVHKDKLKAKKQNCQGSHFPLLNRLWCAPGSSVGIATGYWLDGPAIESRWRARYSSPVQSGSGAHPASCTMGTGSFPGVESGRGVTLTPHPF
jgi:hypothetical protein